MWKRIKTGVLGSCVLAMLSVSSCLSERADINRPSFLRPAESAVAALETRWAGREEEAWQSSGTTICAGGKDSAVHQAQVRIVLAAEAKGEVVRIRMIGGGGYWPKSDWWTPDHAATPARLVFDFGECRGDGAISLAVGELDRDLELEGILTSSNTTECPRIMVQVGNRPAAFTSVMFETAHLENNIGNQGYVVNFPTEFQVSASYKGLPVAGHHLKLMVGRVRHGPIVDSVRPWSSGMADLTGWVKIGTAGEKFQDVTTDEHGDAIGTCKIVRQEVSEFTISIGDLSVAQ